MKLMIGQSIVCTIYASQQWNKTGIHLEAGNTYSFEASGKWRDLVITSGPDGFTRWYMRWTEQKRRVRDANWFALIGTSDGNDSFVIGNGVQSFIAQRDAELVCFANDVEGFYWNNFGAIQLTVVRKS